MNTENNKIIAEFIGYDKKEIKTDLIFYYINKSWYAEYDLKFHSDWNWLMEVVEKIENLNYSLEINKQEENDYQCIIVKKDIIVQTFSSKKIEAVYNACVEFIKCSTWNKILRSSKGVNNPPPLFPFKI